MASVVDWNNLPSVVLVEIFKMISLKQRLNASTTCKEWRKALFSPNFWRDLSIRLCDKNYKSSIEKCQFFAKTVFPSLRNVTIIFDIEEYRYTSQLAEVLSKLSENHQLKKFFLFAFGDLIYNDLSCCTVNLINILKESQCLESIHLSHCWLGLFDDLEKAVEKHKDSLRNLGLGTAIRTYYEKNIFVELVVDFSVFQHLSTLSLDHSWVTDEALKQISHLTLLKRLVLLVDTKFVGYGAAIDTWFEVAPYLIHRELRVNLINGKSKDIMKVFSPEMPITHIKILYCKEMSLSLMRKFSSFKRLKSIWLVASPHEYWLNTFTCLPEQNPLVICAWTCQELEELVITGFEFDFEDLIGIARLRGPELKKLDITEEDIVKMYNVNNTNNWQTRSLYSSEHRVLKSNISSAIGKAWAPLDQHALEKSPYLSPLNSKNNIVEILSKDYEIEPNN